MKKRISTFLAMALLTSVFGTNVSFAEEKATTEVYTEIYSMDFDKLSVTAETTDQTAFTSAYPEAKLVASASWGYEVGSNENDSSDKYLLLKKNGENGGQAAIQLGFTSAPFAANTGKYKLSYDVNFRDAAANGPYLRLKTFHYAPGGIDNWGPVLQAMYPENGKIKATYSTATEVENSWFVNAKDAENAVAFDVLTWHKAEAIIDTDNSKIDYYYDGNYIGSQSGSTLSGNVFAATNFQFTVFQGYQAWEGVCFDNISIAKATDAEAEFVANIETEDQYTESYSLDFDKLTVAAETNDQTAFTAAYPEAKFVAGGSWVYTVSAHEKASDDKYLMLRGTAQGDTSTALQLGFASAPFAANTGKYKLSYDINLKSVAANGPYFRLKSYHYAPGGIDNWGPVYQAIYPDSANGKLMATYSTATAAESSWFADAKDTENAVAFNPDTWHKAEVIIDTDHAKAEYYYDGELVGTQSGSSFLAGNVNMATYFQFGVFNGYDSYDFVCLDNIKIAKLTKAGEKFSVNSVTVSGDKKSIKLDGTGLSAIEGASAVSGTTGDIISATVKTTQCGIVLEFANALADNTEYAIYLESDSGTVSGKVPVGTPTETPDTLVDNKYSNVYTLDFNALKENTELSTDQTELNTAYPEAKLLASATWGYAVASYENNTSDKYLLLQNVGENGGSAALQLGFASAPFAKNSGKYKLSYDISFRGAAANGPYFRLKTFHYAPAVIDNWGPVLQAAYPEGGVTKATYSTVDVSEWPENSWHVSSMDKENAASFDILTWHKAEAIIDTDNSKIDYYYDGNYIGSQSGSTLSGNVFAATNFQFNVFQGWQAWEGICLDNIKIDKIGNGTSVTAFGAIDAYGNELVAGKAFDRALSAINVKTNAVPTESELRAITLTKNGESVTPVVAYDAEKGSIKVTLDTIFTNGNYTLTALGSTYSFAVVTIVGKTELIDFTLVDENGGEIIEGDVVRAKATIKNGAEDATIIIAIYNDDEFAAVDFVTTTKKTLTETISVPLTITNAENVIVTAYIWEGLSNIKPMEEPLYLYN